MGLTLNGKNLLQEKQILSCKSRPPFERLYSLWKQQEAIGVDLLWKHGENMEVHSFTLKHTLWSLIRCISLSGFNKGL